MLYTVYKITNLVNGRFYIGCHQTENIDDGYMGSGKLIQAAIKKHGAENFEKEILATFETADQMFDEEKNLISKLDPEYNLHEGGSGGWNFVNSNLSFQDRSKISATGSVKGGKIAGRIIGDRLKHDLEYRKKHLQTFRPKNVRTFSGKSHSLETKKRIGEANSKHQSGAGNSQFGSMWITNGQQNKKIKKNDAIPEGWHKGRLFPSY